jgi:hypothetical protein
MKEFNSSEFYEFITGELIQFAATPIFIGIYPNLIPVKPNTDIPIDVYQNDVNGAFTYINFIWLSDRYEIKRRHFTRNMQIKINANDIEQFNKICYSAEAQKMIESYYKMRIFS